jgi:pyridoxamine 5'-phosphate oxidase
MMETFPALKKSDVDRNPIKQFATWYDEAAASGIAETDAMTLATATRDGRPSARIVLLKDFDDRGFVFFTNYESRKAKELAENPRACLVAYWLPVKRQVRIEGSVEQVSDEESEDYFQSRPVGSKIGAWASNQSGVVENREVLEQRYAALSERYGEDVPRPPHWGGFRIRPEVIEFWQGRDNRLHDRLRYRLQADETWVIERLGP